MSRREQSRLVDALPDLVSAIFTKVASLAGFALAVTLIYLLYALFSGYVAAYPQLTHDQRLKVIGNLNGASLLLAVSAFIVIAYTLVQLWEFEKLPAILAGVGALLYFGPPFLMAQALGVSIQNNAAAGAVTGALLRVGQMLLAGAALRGIPALVQQLRTGFSGYGADSAMRRAAKKQPGLIHPLSACWRLPYCRAYIRDKCPRYSERKACWRKKSGCLCDDEIMSIALGSANGTSSAARERLILEFLPGAGSAGRTTAAKRLKCQNCFIYLEHQRIKHRYAAPLAVPLTAALFWFFQAQVEWAYASVCQWAARGVQALAFGQVNTGVVQGTFTNPLVKWLILLCVGIYALTYILRFLEYVFFRLKI